MTENRKPGNPLFIAGGPSMNPKGRPKGSKRSRLRTLERFQKRNATLDEYQRLYDHMDSTAEQWAMQKWIEERLTPKPSANAISEEEAERLLERMAKMQGYIKELENKIKEHGLELQRTV